MKALCFDQATAATGWAVGDEHGSPKPGSNSIIHSGVIHAPKREELGERLAFIWRQVAMLVEEHQPDLIGYEEPYFPHQGAGGAERAQKKRYGQAAPADDGADAEGYGKKEKRFNPETLKQLQMVKGLIITVAALKSIPVAGCTPSQWRVTFLGYGRAPKGEADDFMKHQAKRRAIALGHSPASFDEADAIGILYHTLHGRQAQARKQGDLLDLAGKDL